MSTTETININGVLEVYTSMLRLFRTDDLHTLLCTFNIDISGSKSDLQIRAIAFLRDTPRTFLHAYLLKIIDIFKSFYHFMDIDNVSQNRAQNQDQQLVMPVMQCCQQFSPTNTQSQQQLAHTNMQGQQQISELLHHHRHTESPQHLVEQPMYAFNMARSSRDEYNVHVVRPYNINFCHPLMSEKNVHMLPVNQQFNVQTSSNHMVTSTSTSDYNNFEHLATNFRFKKLPFFEIVDEIFKPVILTNHGVNERLKNAVSSELMTALFKFKLSFDQAACITMNMKTSYGSIDYTFLLQMRIGQLQTDFSELIENLPIRFYIQANGDINTLPLYGFQNLHSIDCTQLFKLNSNTLNEVAIHWIRDENTYVMAMYLVKKLNTDILLKRLLNKNRKSPEETKNYIMIKMAEIDPDLQATTSYRFSFICPLGKNKINIPVNSINCNHLQCFDASTFITMNEHSSTWTCPICDESCSYDDLQVQSYFLDIITNPNVPDFVDEIELLPNGEWREFQKPRTISIENISEVSNSSGLSDISVADYEPTENIIDLTTVEDEEDNIYT